MLRQRQSRHKTTTPRATQPSTPSSKTGPLSKSGHGAAMNGADDPRVPLLGARDSVPLSQRRLSTPSSSRDHSSDSSREKRNEDHAKEMENLSRKSQWIVLALSSGACAAFNGVFAKLYVIFLFRVPNCDLWDAEFGGRYTYFHMLFVWKRSRRVL
jgi:hypothetical protein